VNEVLRKVAGKVLVSPKVERVFEKIWKFYCEKDLGEGSKVYKTVETARNEHLDIMEAFRVPDSKALEKVVKMVLKQDMMVVEVGSWKGFSTAVLAKTMADYNGNVFAVDHWMGSEKVWNYEVARTYDIYSIFKVNMISLGLWDIVHPLVMDSQTASQIFADRILDLVFIDADHRYEAFKRDILSWLPKLKDGGVLCGHDCEGNYSEYPQQIKKAIDEHLGDDYIPDIPCHPGVVRALHDCFRGKYQIMPNSTVWYYVKKDAHLS